MKKVFNLSVILAVLMAVFSFTSCGNEEEAASVSVKFSNSGTVELGDPIVATITADEKIESIELWKNNSRLKSYSQMPTLTNGVATFTIPAADINAVGTYELRITTKGNGATNGTFNVIFIPDFTGAPSKITENGAYYYKQGTTIGTLVVSNLTTASVTVSLDGKTAVELSDAVASYLMNDGTNSQRANAVANASKVVLAKLSGKAEIVSNELTGSPITGAVSVVFVKQ